MISRPGNGRFNGPNGLQQAPTKTSAKRSSNLSHFVKKNPGSKWTSRGYIFLFERKHNAKHEKNTKTQKNTLFIAPFMALHSSEVVFIPQNCSKFIPSKHQEINESYHPTHPSIQPNGSTPFNRSIEKGRFKPVCCKLGWDTTPQNEGEWIAWMFLEGRFLWLDKYIYICIIFIYINYIHVINGYQWSFQLLCIHLKWVKRDRWQPLIPRPWCVSASACMEQIMKNMTVENQVVEWC